MREPDLDKYPYYYEVNGPFWILVNGAEAPEGTRVVPTHYSYIHLAIEKGSDDEEQWSGSRNLSHSETGINLAAFSRPGEPTKIH